MNITYTLNEVQTAAQFVLDHANSKIILFEGEMGTGKTTLIKTLVKLLGSTDNVSSPTFSLVNEYESETTSIFHFDLYRVKDEEELYNFGIDTYIYGNNYIIVEWPQLLKPILQDNYTIVSIAYQNEHSRQLKVYNTK